MGEVPGGKRVFYTDFPPIPSRLSPPCHVHSSPNDGGDARLEAVARGFHAHGGDDGLTQPLVVARVAAEDGAQVE